MIGKNKTEFKLIFKEDWNKMSKGMEELLEAEENDNSPDTIIMGEGIIQQMRNHKPRKLTKKEFEELYNSYKPQPFIIWTSAEQMAVWDEAIRNLMKKQNE